MSSPSDTVSWLADRAALRQAVGLAIVGVVCFTGQLAVQVEELVAQAEDLIAGGAEDS